MSNLHSLKFLLIFLNIRQSGSKLMSGYKGHKLLKKRNFQKLKKYFWMLFSSISNCKFEVSNNFSYCKKDVGDNKTITGCPMSLNEFHKSNF